jgi:hypothetical protein
MPRRNAIIHHTRLLGNLLMPLWLMQLWQKIVDTHLTRSIFIDNKGNILGLIYPVSRVLFIVNPSSIYFYTINNIPASYSEGSRFKSRLGDRLR